ncbi:ECF RNA polymerase sigma-E factor [Gemmata obscuriglobus]|nr:RNA polymerase sigma factor [Gemmata obscuriglobus]QEG30847.1 ECF RNA polymerase sigma-E factor [Gemmata obscuriglobus]VTS10178.1 sigma-70 family rna polymerase sigma factor : RNA polymerase sigma factor, sigma-70 family OS=Singulisphaera acidiphila (strain ATCC BAA-1392 / DSM 18658 / VKM B-2454 / MOB10) GN=Sinac_4264 PE=4 SV=1: Sigma70_r2: Sigma70_r4_2 [Gemmata obscuriglobus UQM 2246]
MAVSQPLCNSLQQLNRALLAAKLADLPDAELIGRFAERRDESAFAALVRRHGPLVLGVCRRVLRHEQDAEDAFQATFLVLARDATAVRRAGAVGSWLYGVAYNVARRAETARRRRAAREREAAVRQPTAAPETAPDDLRDVLDRELNALPDKYRTAVVLCDLTGLTAQQASVEVGCPAKTLGTRLARGRALLADRLVRRGVGLSVGALVAISAPSAAGAVPPRLAEFTVQLVAGSNTGPATAPPAVAALAEGVSNVMALKTLKLVAVLVCGVVLVGGVAKHGGFALHARHTKLARSAAPGTTETPDGSPAVEQKNPADFLDHFHRFIEHVHDVLGIGPGEQIAAAPGEGKKDETPAGVWVKKDGELKVEFSEKGVLSLSPHGENKVVVIVCEFGPGKDGLVKAKVTGFEGIEEAKKKIMDRLPLGTEFTFVWKVNGGSATLGDVKSGKDTADVLKSHLEAEYTKK